MRNQINHFEDNRALAWSLDSKSEGRQSQPQVSLVVEGQSQMFAISITLKNLSNVTRWKKLTCVAEMKKTIFLKTWRRSRGGVGRFRFSLLFLKSGFFVHGCHHNAEAILYQHVGNQDEGVFAQECEKWGWCVNHGWQKEAPESGKGGENLHLRMW